MQPLGTSERAGAYARLDERARVLLALLGVVATIATWEPAVLAVLLAAALSVALAARVTWRDARRFVLFSCVLVTALVAATFLTHDGTTEERGLHALAQSLRMLALIAYTSVLSFTIAPTRWGVTFRGLGLPDRFAMAVELAVRFVPTLAERFSATLRAQSARGLDLSARVGPLVRIRRLVPVLVPVLLDSIVAGEDVADAMDLRAFGARPRTWSGARGFGAAEWGTVAFGAGLVALSVVAG